MQPFAVGQSIMHPVHGAGKIIDVQNIELVEGFKRYYEIEFLAKKLTLHVPIRKVDDLGLREVMSPSKVEKVLRVLRKKPNALPDDYKKRRKQLEDLLDTGQPLKIAEAVRDLTWRQKNDRLSTVDNQLLSKGKDRLIAEITTVMDSEALDARHEIDAALSQTAAGKKETVH